MRFISKTVSRNPLVRQKLFQLPLQGHEGEYSDAKLGRYTKRATYKLCYNKPGQKAQPTKIHAF